MAVRTATNVWGCVSLLLLGGGWVSHVQAQFTGEFGGTWTLSNTPDSVGGLAPDGTVDASVPGSVTITGGNNAGLYPDPLDPSSTIFRPAGGVTAYSFTVPPSTGNIYDQVNFTWTYSNDDGAYDVPRYTIIPAADPGNPATFYLGAHLREVVSSPYQANGQVQISLQTGDILSFEVETYDGLLGAGVLTISGLQPAPEPSEWAAISFGVLGLVWLGKKRFSIRAH